MPNIQVRLGLIGCFFNIIKFKFYLDVSFNRLSPNYHGLVYFRELNDQIEERQKNDYKAIFLEDRVAMLISKNKELSLQWNSRLDLNRSYSKGRTTCFNLFVKFN